MSSEHKGGKAVARLGTEITLTCERGKAKEGLEGGRSLQIPSVNG